MELFHRDGLDVGEEDDENVEQLVDGVAICGDDPGCGSSCGDGIARSAGTGFGKLGVAVEQLRDCFHAHGAYPLQHFCAPGQDQHRRLPNCARRLVLFKSPNPLTATSFPSMCEIFVYK